MAHINFESAQAPSIQPQLNPPSDYQRIQTNPREFGAGLYIGMEHLGAAATEVSKQYGQLAAEDQVNKVVTGLDDLQSKMLSLRGRDASDQRDAIRQQMLDVVNAGRSNLFTADQISEFNQQTRYLYSRADRAIVDHADQQLKVWGSGVYKNSQEDALAKAAQAAGTGDMTSAQLHTNDAVAAAIKGAKLEYGQNLSPEIAENVERMARANSARGQIMAMIPGNPTGAKQLLDQNSQYFNGLEYEALSQRLGAHADKAQADAIVNSIIPRLGGVPGGGQNNPGNIRVPGSVGTGPEAFQSFPTPEAGINAIKQNLIAYKNQHGIDTLSGVISRWSPPNENATSQLIANASRRTGFAPDEKIDLADPSVQGRLVSAIVTQEQGGHKGYPTRENLIGAIPADLPDNIYDRVYSGVNRRYNQLEAATNDERSKLKAEYQGGLGMLQDGREFNYDPAQIRSVFPTEQADQMIANLEDARQIGQQIQGIRGMPISDILSQQAANRAILSNSTGEGYERQRRLSAAFDKAAEQHIKQLSLDPAGYVSSTNPTIEAAREAAEAQTPQQAAALAQAGQQTASERYAILTLGEQERLQVPPDNRHVLTQQQAQGFAAQIMGDPEGSRGRMRALETEFGSQWPQVWHDLTTTGKLSPAYQMVGSLDNEGDAALLARGLASINKEGVNQALDQVLDKGAAGATRPSQMIRERVLGDQNIRDYTQSMLASGASSEQVRGIVNSVALLAQAKALYHSQQPPTAADDAIQSAIGKWEFMPNGGARIPRANADNITGAAHQTVAGLSLPQLQPPAIYSGDRAPGSATSEDWLRVLQAAPNWVTVGNSIRLMDNGGRFVRRDGGGFVEVPFTAGPPVQAESLTAPQFPPP